MDRERRQSKRVSTRLPCQWQMFPRQPSMAELRAQFNIPLQALHRAELNELGDKISNALHGVADPSIRDVLALFEQKLSLLERLRDDGPMPELQLLGLSAEGFDISTTECLAEGAWLGVHLVLQDSTTVVASAQVKRCTVNPYNNQAANHGDNPDSFVVGAVFHDLEPASARSIAKYVMRTEPSEA